MKQLIAFLFFLSLRIIAGDISNDQLEAEFLVNDISALCLHTTPSALKEHYVAERENDINFDEEGTPQPSPKKRKLENTSRKRKCDVLQEITKEGIKKNKTQHPRAKRKFIAEEDEETSNKKHEITNEPKPQNFILERDEAHRVVQMAIDTLECDNFAGAIGLLERLAKHTVRMPDRQKLISEEKIATILQRAEDKVFRDEAAINAEDELMQNGACVKKERLRDSRAHLDLIKLNITALREMEFAAHDEPHQDVNLLVPMLVTMVSQTRMFIDSLSDLEPDQWFDTLEPLCFPAQAKKSDLLKFNDKFWFDNLFPVLGIGDKKVQALQRKAQIIHLIRAMCFEKIGTKEEILASLDHLFSRSKKKKSARVNKTRAIVEVLIDRHEETALEDYDNVLANMMNCFWNDDFPPKPEAPTIQLNESHIKRPVKVKTFDESWLNVKSLR